MFSFLHREFVNLHEGCLRNKNNVFTLHFNRGFIKVFNRRATEFDTWAKNFEILWSQGRVFLHFEAADNDFQQPKKITFLDNLIMIKWLNEVRQTNIWRDEEFSLEGESQKY